jgi:Asp-tRNA(Asn)/Glu-tRNA(Gln) amidotransferase A subunit family amidase
VALGDPASVVIAGLRVATLEASGPVEEAVDMLLAGGAAQAEGLPRSVVDDAAGVTWRYWRRRSLAGPEADQLLLDWDRFRRRLLAASEGFDVIVSPVVAEPAPRRRPMDGDDYLWTLPWSLTGWPAMSLPWGTSKDGLPLAVQLVAPAWQDHVVVSVAAWLEAATQPA